MKKKMNKMFAKIVLVVFLVTLSVSLAKDDEMVNTDLGKMSNSSKMTTKNPDIYSVDLLKSATEKYGTEESIKQKGNYLGTQLKQHIESTKKTIKNGYVGIEEELKKKMDKIKKDFPGLVEKLKTIHEKTHELSKIPEKIGKHILGEDKFHKPASSTGKTKCD